MTRTAKSAIHDDLHYALDPIAFANACGIEPDQWQTKVLTTEARRMMLLTGRQVGKSTICALKALHQAFYTDSETVVMVAPSLRQAQELFARTRDLYHKCQVGLPITLDSSLRVQFANGSRILALPGTESSIRGYTSGLSVVDEAARCEESLISAISPMLATTGGQMFAISTPFGRQGWFYDAWGDRNSGWQKIRVRSDQCPRISKDFLRAERRSMPEAFYRSEYLAEFTELEEALFAQDLIDRMVSKEVTPLWS